MPNKYLQAGIGLTAALLTTPFLVQTAQATDYRLSNRDWFGGNVQIKTGPQDYTPPMTVYNCDLAVPGGQGCTIANLSGINPDGIPPTDVDTGINNEDDSFSLCPVPPIGGAGDILICGEDLIEDNPGDGTISPCPNLQPGEVCSFSGIGQPGGIGASAVPEPLTILGASAAIAFGAGFKRRKSGNG